MNVIELRGKFQRRTLTILTHAAHGMALPLIGPLFSLLVIRVAAVALWGEFVRVLILAQLAAHVVGWGNKDYLLREFSLRPGRIAHAWQSNLFTRLLIVTPLPLLLIVLGQPAARAALLVGVCLALVLDQSYDVVVLFRRDFVYALAAEGLGLAALAVPVLWAGRALSLDLLLAGFLVSNLIKSAAFALRFRGLLASGPIGRPPGAPLHGQARIRVDQLRSALPFFLLGLSGLLQSRVDLYVVSASLPGAAVGQYQVFSNLMLYGQAAAGFILLPFVKGLYRLPPAASLRLAARLFAGGAAVVATFVPAVFLILIRLYHIDLPALMYVAGGLSVWPIFFYLPIIYALFKAERQSLVIAVNCLGLAVSLLLNLLLLPRLGLSGAAVAGAAAQWAMALAYLYSSQTIAFTERREHAVAVPELPRDA